MNDWPIYLSIFVLLNAGFTTGLTCLFCTHLDTVPDENCTEGTNLPVEGLVVTADSRRKKLNVALHAAVTALNAGLPFGKKQRILVELCFVFHGVYHGTYTFGRSKDLGVDEDMIGKCKITDKGGVQGLQGQFCFCDLDNCNNKPVSEFDLLCYECFHSFMTPDSYCLNGDGLSITLADNDITGRKGADANSALQVYKSGKAGIDACLTFNGTQDGKWVFFRKKVVGIRKEFANTCQNGTSQAKELKGQFCFCTKDLCNSFAGQTADVNLQGRSEIQVYLLAVAVVTGALINVRSHR